MCSQEEEEGVASARRPQPPRWVQAAIRSVSKVSSAFLLVFVSENFFPFWLAASC